MQGIRNRVVKLEQRLNAVQSAGNLVVVRCGSDQSEVANVLAAAGIDESNPRHTIVVLQTMFEDNSGGLAADQHRAQVLSITDLHP